MRIIGKKIAIVTATIRRLFTRMFNQMGKMNAKYLNKEIWYIVVKTSKFLAHSDSDHIIKSPITLVPLIIKTTCDQNEANRYSNMGIAFVS